MARLNGKVALVTGGASGMGASHARSIVAEGGQVLIADIADEKGQTLARELGDAAEYVHLDVTDPEQWDAAVRAAEERFGKLNVLVNNAGLLDGGALGEYSLDAWNRIMAVNVTSAFIGMTAALPALERAQPASIVNVSSAAGLRGVPYAHGYTASKFALRGLTKSAAVELSNRGVRVNSVHPGGVRTPMVAAALEAGGITEAETDLIKRAADPSEISAMVVFLASDESSFSTGAEFVADGGISAGLRN